MYFPWYQILFFFLVYSFLGWTIEVAVYAVTKRKFYNIGFLSLPFILTYGFTMCSLVVLLPTFGDNLVGQYIMTLLQAAAWESIVNFAIRKLCPNIVWTERKRIFGGSLTGFAASAVIALAYLLVYHILHPLILVLTQLVPALVLKIAMPIAMALIALDIATVTVAFRQRGKKGFNKKQKDSAQRRLANRIADRIWSRVQKTYPGVKQTKDGGAAKYTFAKGLGFDKLFWVFLLSALLGDLIETLYCGFVDGEWMSRSSLLYGPFSLVWGVGAVVLTITLLPLSKKNDRWVFMGGFFIGGAYEYMCSVFTEIMFGTVFWDYSYMPLNIGGRTNVLFMFFWGILSVVWVKTIFPRMEQIIEKVPPLWGKIATWVVLLFMVLNTLLTGSAMLRYNVRKTAPETYSDFDRFIDMQYPDSRIEARWPNMIITE
ncbi:MAG: putative ABC transporter permease [Oscillospiraceae bacterium]|nr:putative ABC transporter permease [Oscillospiraceae bacterium]